MNSSRERLFAALEQEAKSEVVASEVQQLRARLLNADEQSHEPERTVSTQADATQADATQADATQADATQADATYGERFRSRAETAGAIVLHADEPEDVPALLEEYLRTAAAVVLSEDDLVTSCGLIDVLHDRNAECRVLTVSDATLQLDADEWKHVYAAADIGITAAVAGVAESGAVIITSSEKESRSVSLLPHTHVVLLREHDIVPSLVTSATILRRLITERGAGAVTLIDGPSKTADIEKVLVTGVHGPRTFIIVLIGDGRDAASPANQPL